MAGVRLRQICLVAQELASPERALAEVLGARPCHRDPNLARYGLENVMFRLGDRFIEIVAPIQDGTAAGRFLQRGGGQGGYMAIFDCPDPDGLGAHAEKLGVPVVNRMRVDHYLGVQLHPKGCRAAMIEFNRTDGGEALEGPYWPAGPDWQAAPETDPLCRLTTVTLDSPVPGDLAAHWGRLLGIPDSASNTLEAGGVTLKFEQARFEEARRETLSTLGLHTADRDAILERAEAHGLTVEQNSFHLAGVRWCFEHP
jgi:hypothetical protein|tara:strand:+ start:1526 stop:2293 length:768 start_codon:yes stop_codon:yes gene_type:complete